MRNPVLVDTGPLVAALDHRDQHHAWVTDQLALLDPPLLTCEPVLTEVCFLFRQFPRAIQALFEMTNRGALEITFRLQEHRAAVAKLMHRYEDVPMSLADACLVRMAELHADSVVLTLGHDFKVYRKHRRQGIPTAMPERL